jgi:hypothetical protein
MALRTEVSFLREKTFQACSGHWNIAGGVSWFFGENDIEIVEVHKDIPRIVLQAGSHRNRFRGTAIDPTFPALLNSFGHVGEDRAVRVIAPQ